MILGEFHLDNMRSDIFHLENLIFPKNTFNHSLSINKQLALVLTTQAECLKKSHAVSIYELSTEKGYNFAWNKYLCKCENIQCIKN